MTHILCQYCFAVAEKEDVPPHGWDTPCPLRVNVDEALIAKLDAERMGWLRMNAGVTPTDRIADAFERFTGTEEESD